MHSSTVTVAVVPETSLENDHPALRRNPDDFHLEWYSGSGAGGQHRNKHQNSARLRHVPTGIVVTAQCRKRPESEAQARSEMLHRLDACLSQSDRIALRQMRLAQCGSGEGADKRRTYRFQEGLVTDHVTGKTKKIRTFLKGRADLLW